MMMMMIMMIGVDDDDEIRMSVTQVPKKRRARACIERA